MIICDENAGWGGGAFDAEIDGQSAQKWIGSKVAELTAHPDVTLLSRTTVFGY